MGFTDAIKVKGRGAKGMLTIFTSYTPGAGKSYAMVQKAMEEKAKGRKVLVGFLHGGHRDVTTILKDNGIEQWDGSARGLKLCDILARKPDLVVMDEMGMKVKGHGFVYDVIEQLLKKGVDVYTSTNLKRFEGANPFFKEVTGIAIKNTIPDRFLSMADEIYFIDREPKRMIRDFQSGQLFDEKYMRSRIMQKNFRMETLEKYREISLVYLKKVKKSKTKLNILERN